MELILIRDNIAAVTVSLPKIRNSIFGTEITIYLNLLLLF
jgi:hypothetical protein